jgi:asparagine synthase (glutamine-hydrolysing)
MRTVYGETPEETPLVDRMLYLDWQFILADSDLRKVGRMCELAGVDVCFPMLADGVVDLSLQVPASKKLPGQRLRHFYKHAMRDFLPTEILRKKKQGFGLPFGQWLKENKGLQDLVYPALESFAQREILHPEFLPRLVAEHRDGHASYHGYVIWDVLMLETWLQAHGHAA